MSVHPLPSRKDTSTRVNLSPYEGCVPHFWNCAERLIWFPFAIPTEWDAPPYENPQDRSRRIYHQPRIHLPSRFAMVFLWLVTLFSIHTVQSVSIASGEELPAD